METKSLRKWWALALWAMISAGCATGHLTGASPTKVERDDSSPFPIIDSHVHTYFTDEPDPESGILDSKKEFLREMNEAGVVGAISHVPAGVTDFPDLRSFGVIHCAGIAETVNVRELEKGLKSKKYGCIKIYLGYIHQFAADKKYTPAYRLAEKYDVPVVFHTGDTDSTRGILKYADPLTVDEVVVKYPKIRFVLAHCGNPWIQSAAEVAFKNQNVWLDGSAFLVGDLGTRSKEKIDRTIIQPLAWIFNYLDDPEKLMFGTDWPLVNIGAYVQAFKKAIPRSAWHQVFFANAVKVFKIPVRSSTSIHRSQNAN
jgi:predicted TIM-barrel fold metal-dependent hydrolase